MFNILLGQGWGLGWEGGGRGGGRLEVLANYLCTLRKLVLLHVTLISDRGGGTEKYGEQLKENGWLWLNKHFFFWLLS